MYQINRRIVTISKKDIILASFDPTGEDEEDEDLLYDMFKENVNEVFETRGNPAKMWKIIGKDMGWLNRTGHRIAMVNDYETFAEAIYPKTSELTVYLYKDKKGGIYTKIYHHDSPTGETYIFAPCEEEEEQN